MMSVAHRKFFDILGLITLKYRGGGWSMKDPLPLPLFYMKEGKATCRMCEKLFGEEVGLIFSSFTYLQQTLKRLSSHALTCTR